MCIEPFNSNALIRNSEACIGNQGKCKWILNTSFVFRNWPLFFWMDLYNKSYTLKHVVAYWKTEQCLFYQTFYWFKHNTNITSMRSIAITLAILWKQNCYCKPTFIRDNFLSHASFIITTKINWFAATYFRDQAFLTSILL